MAKKTHKLTPELAAKLRGISVVSDTIDYKLEIEDVPDEFTPVFTIKNITVKDTKKIKEFLSNVNEEDNNDELMNDFMDKLAQEHIVGWKNLYDLSTLEAYEFKAGKVGCDKDVYDLLPTGLKAKVLAFIYSLAGSM